jgi:hypothetical protein
MNNINKEKLNLFLDEVFINEFKAACNEIIKHDLIDGAVFMQTAIERILSNYPEIKEKDIEKYNIYKLFLIKLRFVNLLNLKDEGIFHLIKNYFDYVYLIPEYNIIDKIKNKLAMIYELEERNKFKDNLKKVLTESGKKITSFEIKYNNSSSLPTVENWLKYYRAEAGNSSDKLKKVQFITNNYNIKKLNKNEKDKIKKLIDLYQYLSVDPRRIENIDDRFVGILPNKELAIFERGNMEKIPSNIKNLAEKILNKNQDTTTAELREDLKNFRPGSLEYKAIEEEIERLEKENKQENL